MVGTVQAWILLRNALPIYFCFIMRTQGWLFMSIKWHQSGRHSIIVKKRAWVRLQEANHWFPGVPSGSLERTARATPLNENAKKYNLALGSLRTSLLCIVGELAAMSESVTVGISDMWQVTGERWHMTFFYYRHSLIDSESPIFAFFFIYILSFKIISKINQVYFFFSFSFLLV